MCIICIHMEGYAAVQKSLLLAESFLGYKGEGNASKVVVFFCPPQRVHENCFDVQRKRVIPLIVSQF